MNSSLFFGLTLVFYLAASLLYIIHLAFKGSLTGRLASGVTLAGFAVQTIALGLRWKESYDLGWGHIPLSNMYESMVFFGWSIIMIYLIFEWRYKIRSLGAVVLPLALLVIASVSLNPSISKQIEPLIPALQSNWLTIHVLTSFFGYAAFAVSFGVSVLYLIFNTDSMGEISYWVGRLAIPGVMAMSFPLFREGSGKMIAFGLAGLVFLIILYLGGPVKGSFRTLFPDMKFLDELNYRSIMVGFPMLTLGIITGAAWANYAWGTYWSWDPKETWSLITWFIYAAFLHARITAGWRGKKAAVLAIIGFGAVVFTYIGVNYLLSGLHSYA
jgi:cytochrome c-type biogenesis protein CcsB